MYQVIAQRCVYGSDHHRVIIELGGRVKPIRIVLAEDHALMREGTRRALEQSSDMTVVGEAGDGQEALDLLKRLQPDVAILDIRMPVV